MANTYPYIPGDRLQALFLDADFELSRGSTPPSGARGGADQYKLWMDNSASPPTLRMATVTQASTNYQLTDWGTLGTIDLPSRRFSYQGAYFTTDYGYEWTNAGHFIYDAGGGSLAFRVGPVGGSYSYITMTDQGALLATSFELTGSQHYIYDASPNLNFRVGSAGPFFTMRSDGNFVAPTGFTISGHDHDIYDAAGVLNFQVGPVGGPDAYFSMHPNGQFQLDSILVNNVAVTAGIHSQNIYLNGSGFTPAIVGDATNIRFQLDSGNGQFIFENYSGGQIFNVHSDGNVFAPGFNVSGTGHMIFDSGGGADLSFRVGPSGGAYYYFNMTNDGYMHASSGFALDNETHSMYDAGGGVLNFKINGGAAYVSMRPNGDVECGNDSVAHGVFRQHELGSGLKGARVECWAGDWDSMQFGMTTGHLSVSPDGGTSGFIFNSDSSYSDVRLKDNIRDTDVDALEILRQTPVRAFEWNAKGRELMPWASPVECGLVAQELEETIPVATGTAPFADEPMYINDQNLTPYLIRAIQQIADRLDAGGL